MLTWRVDSCQGLAYFGGMTTTPAVPTSPLLGRLDVRCPRCEAPALLPCRNVRTGEILPYSYHRKRIEVAVRKTTRKEQV